MGFMRRLGCGGIFLDMAVHDFDLARFLVGEVEEAQQTCCNRLPFLTR
jgi:predicted dehydrogenase